jgi:very-short-patch-repair endonuclease
MFYKKYSPRYVISLARKMRNEMTLSEGQLWNELSSKKFYGLRFRKQHPTERYIADFYCHEFKLIIEIDGEVHLKQKEYDKRRDDYLTASGYTVLRFTDKEIIADINQVLNGIKELIYKNDPSKVPLRGI